MSGRPGTDGNPGDPTKEPSMVSRRGLVTAAGAIGSLGAGYAVVNWVSPLNVDVDIDTGALMNDSRSAVEDVVDRKPEDPYHQTFGGGFVEEIVFEENGAMQVSLDGTHNSESFAIWHVSENIRDRDPLYGTNDLPRFGGTVRVPFGSQLTSRGTYPSNEFKMVGFDMTYDWITFYPDALNETGRVRFWVPEEFIP